LAGRCARTIRPATQSDKIKQPAIIADRGLFYLVLTIDQQHRMRWHPADVVYRFSARWSVQAQMPQAEQADEPDDDQIDRDDVTEQARHHQNENACHKRD